MKKGGKLYWFITVLIVLLAIAINVFIIVHSCLDATKSSQASSWVVNIIATVVNAFKAETINASNIDVVSKVVRKVIGHFGLFMVSGLLSSQALYLSLSPYSWCKHYMNAMFSLVFGLFIGILTEMIQLAVPGRSGESIDVLIDFSGYLLGTLIIGIILFSVIRNRKQNKRA